MKNKLLLTMCIIVSLLISGCTNKYIDSFKNEQDYLANKILELEEQISQKEEDIKHIQDLNTKKTMEIKELEESLIMLRFSANSRLRDKNDSFDIKKYI